MALKYLWSGATGAGTGANWANAYTTLNPITVAAGDTLFVAHDHSELTTNTNPGTWSTTVSNPSKVVCVNRLGSVPPVSADRRATAVIATSGDTNLTLTGIVHYDGIIFIAGNSTGSPFIRPGTVVAGWIRFDNCSLRIGSSGASGYIDITYQNGTIVEWNNTTVSFANVSQGLTWEGSNRFVWRNTPSALLGTIPTVLFKPNVTYGSDIECIGVDLSAAGSGKTIFGTIANGQVCKYRLIDCKLDAAVTRNAALTLFSNSVEFVRSGAAGVNYQVYRQQMTGTLTEETSVVRTTGGASDGTTPLSWKIATTANANYSEPFESPPIAIWNNTVGSAVTATVEGIWGGTALPNDDECWIDVEFLGSSSSPQGSFVNDGKANLLATAAAQTTSSAAWAFATATSAWDAATVANVTLSGGNLVVTNTSTAAETGARLAAALGKTTGKYYFEITTTTMVGTAGGNAGFGVATTASTYTAMGNNATAGAALYPGNGSCWSNGVNQINGIGPMSSGDVCGIAIDLDNRKAWFRKGASGNWLNGVIGVQNPVTNTGGNPIPAGTIAPICHFGGGGATTGNVWTANFGATAFVGAVPSGFTSGWTSVPPPAFKLAATFTPQQKGWIYARAKCAAGLSTFYIDPLVTLT